MKKRFLLIQLLFILFFFISFAQFSIGQDNDKEERLQSYNRIDTSKAQELLNMSNKLYNSGDFKEAYTYYYKYYIYMDSVRAARHVRIVNEAKEKYDVDKLNERHKELEDTNLYVKEAVHKDRYLIPLFLVVIALIILISFLIIQTSVIKSRKKLTEISERNIRQQLNPEFIFSTLNSIQYSIFSDNKIDSQNKLSKFARYMRLILDNSQYEYISLQRELEVLKFYLEIEKYRLHNNFNYAIDLDEDIDIYESKIPSLLLLIFLENTIHNSRLKGVNTNVYIRIDLKGREILCNVTFYNSDENMLKKDLADDDSNNWREVEVCEDINLLEYFNKKLEIKSFTSEALQQDKFILLMPILN